MNKENKLINQYCSFTCEYAKAVDNKTSCMTFNSIDCGKYHIRMDKGRLCYKYIK